MSRLYKAVCAWLEADTKAKCDPFEAHPQGNNFTQAEHAHAYTSDPELHAGHRPKPEADDSSGYGRPISLRWHP